MLYRWFNTALFWFGVGRYRSGDFTRNQQIAREVVQHRLIVLLNAGALVLAVGAIDAWLTPRLGDWLEFGKVGELIHAPDVATLRLILEVTALSSSAVIALILSISLLVLDRAADKFGGQVARLQMDDPLRKYVVDLLVTAFLLSFWGLFLSQTAGLEPIVTTILAGIFLSMGVVTLVLYHDHAFSFMVSSKAANSLQNRAQELLIRLRYEAHRPAIADYLRRRMNGLIDGQRSLVRVLLANGDDDGSAEVMTALAAELGAYVRTKHRIPIDSAWYPVERVRLTQDSGSSYFDMRRMMRAAGLGPPTTSERNDMWVEDALTKTIEDARRLAIEKNGTRTLAYEVTSLGFLSQAAIEREDEWTASWARREMNELSTRVDDSNLSRWGASVVNSIGTVTDAHLKALDGVVDSAIVARIDWRDGAGVRKLRLPSKQQAALNQLQERLSVELVVEGTVVTPTTVLQTELETELAKVRRWHEEGLDAWIDLVLARLEAAPK